MHQGVLMVYWLTRCACVMTVYRCVLTASILMVYWRILTASGALRVYWGVLFIVYWRYTNVYWCILMYTDVYCCVLMIYWRIVTASGALRVYWGVLFIVYWRYTNVYWYILMYTDVCVLLCTDDILTYSDCFRCTEGILKCTVHCVLIVYWCVLTAGVLMVYWSVLFNVCWRYTDVYWQQVYWWCTDVYWLLHVYWGCTICSLSPKAFYSLGPKIWKEIEEQLKTLSFRCFKRKLINVFLINT